MPEDEVPDERSAAADEETAHEGTAHEGTGEGPAPASSGRSRPSGMRVVAALLVGVLAFAVTVQVRQDEAEDYSNLRGVELVELLKSVDAANGRLERQIEELTQTRDDLRSSNRRSDEARRQARKRAADLAILAGTVGATGPGVRIRIEDPEGVVDAGTVLDVIEELRDAGAEAIAVNSQARVVGQTAFVDVETGILVGTKTVKAPYTIEAIGSASTLSEAAQIRGGLIDRLKANGAAASVTTADDITITALAESPTPQYARSDD